MQRSLKSRHPTWNNSLDTNRFHRNKLIRILNRGIYKIESLCSRFWQSPMIQNQIGSTHPKNLQWEDLHCFNLWIFSLIQYVHGWFSLPAIQRVSSAISEDASLILPSWSNYWSFFFRQWYPADLSRHIAWVCLFLWM